MSSFLQRLKSGATAVDNKAPPDSAGVVVRRIEKKVLSQPVEQLGITLGVDAEVVQVAPHSPAAAANIPSGFMIFDVNGEFVENEQQFNEAARKSINLIIKLQNTSGMSELIALVLEDDDRRSSGAITASALNFDELLRNTPRFNFLSGDHPLFRRYNKRLSQQRQAAALIAQRTAEAELQRQKEIKERMRRALEEEAALQKKREQEEAERQRLKAAQEPPRFVPEEPFLKIIKDESAFGRAEKEVKKPEAVPSPKIAPTASVAPAEQPSVSTADSGEPSSKPSNEAPPLSAEELLSLVGIAPEAPETAPPPLEELAEVIALPPPRTTGTYITLPAEEYTLCSGERVVSVIKQRTGPVPPPPPGKPPVMNEAAAQLFRATTAEPVVTSSLPKREQRRDAPGSAAQQRRRRSRTPPSERRGDRDDYREHSHRRRRRDDDTPPPRHHRSSRDSRHRR